MKNILLQQLKHYVAIFCIGIFCSLGIGGCSQENDLAKLPEATDDATLLASQLKLLQTRATNATNTTLITTAKSVNFTVENNSPIIVDWGDGNNDIDVFAHTYTDDLPVHTICFNGAQDAIQKLICQNQELILLDITKDTSLTQIYCDENRISELDLSKNKILTHLSCSRNLLSQLNMDYNFELEYVNCSSNKIDSIKIDHLSKLNTLSCNECNLKEINTYHNLLLKSCFCHHNQLTSINFTENSLLTDIGCNDNQLTELLFPTNSSNLARLSCENNHLNNLILPGNCSKLRIVTCQNNDFFFDPTPDVTFNKLLVLVSSLPQRTDGIGILILSETPYTGTLRIVTKSKNWTLMTH